MSGIVDEVGGSVTRLRVGQRVIGLSDRLDAPSKGQAELDEWAVAGVPDELDLIEAATLPLIGLTAEQALDSGAGGLAAAHRAGRPGRRPHPPAAAGEDAAPG